MPGFVPGHAGHRLRLADRHLHLRERRLRSKVSERAAAHRRRPARVPRVPTPGPWLRHAGHQRNLFEQRRRQLLSARRHLRGARRRGCTWPTGTTAASAATATTIPTRGGSSCSPPRASRWLAAKSRGRMTTVAGAIEGLNSPNLATQFLARERLLAAGAASVPKLLELVQQTDSHPQGSRPCGCWTASAAKHVSTWSTSSRRQSRRFGPWPCASSAAMARNIATRS